MFKTNKPNPYNFFEIRRSSHPCEHFEFINLPLKYNLEQSISKWISDHMKGRYYIGKSLKLSDDNAIENILKVGFEDPKEMSYFTLACPHLKYN